MAPRPRISPYFSRILYVPPEDSAEEESEPSPLRPSSSIARRQRKRTANSESGRTPECACQSIGEHVQAAKPRLIQAVADNPWKLIIAVMLLNKTRGSVAIPIFWKLMEQWPTPKDLAQASLPELVSLLKPLGLHNRRAARLIELSSTYLHDPPLVDEPRASRCPTTPQKSRPQSTDVFGTSTPCESSSATPKALYPATLISHLPGVGRYALDSYRIFSPQLPGGGAASAEAECLAELPSHSGSKELPFHSDGSTSPLAKRSRSSMPSTSPLIATLRGYPLRKRPLHSAEGVVFQDEWKTVRPLDKELRKYLVWRWAIEGVRWDPDVGCSGAASDDDLWLLPHWF